MKLTNPDRGVIIMGDVWDYKLSKADMTWDLASRIIPEKPGATGRWTESSYLENAQKTLVECSKVIEAVFTEDK